jgi:hypothetical protein
MEIQIDFISILLKSFCHNQAILKPIQATIWVYPNPQTHSVHASVTQNCISRSGLVVAQSVFEYASAVLQHLQRTEIMSFIEKWGGLMASAKN